MSSLLRSFVASLTLVASHRSKRRIAVKGEVERIKEELKSKCGVDVGEGGAMEIEEGLVHNFSLPDLDASVLLKRERGCEFPAWRINSKEGQMYEVRAYEKRNDELKRCLY